MPNAVDFLGLTIELSRDGAAVTGRVVFPTPAPYIPERRRRHSRHLPPSQGGMVGADGADKGGGVPRLKPTTRTECPIAFNYKEPDTNPDTTNLHPRAQRRLEAVLRFQELRGLRPQLSMRTLTMRIVHERPDLNVDHRTIEIWIKRYNAGGADALCDRYSHAPPRVLHGNKTTILESIELCSWWAWRIGNIDCIDTARVHMAIVALARGYSLANLVASVDNYYAYPADRDLYPFKTFERWFRYDLDKWFVRAASAAHDPPPESILDYQRAESFKDTRDYPGKRSRRRAASDPTLARNLAAMDDLGRGHNVAVPPADANGRSGHRPDSAASPQSVVGCVPDAPPGGRAAFAEAFLTLDDRLRKTLLTASGDPAKKTVRQAHMEAIASFALWWPDLPHEVQDSVDCGIGDLPIPKGGSPGDVRAVDPSSRELVSLRTDGVLRLIRDLPRSGLSAIRVPIAQESRA